MVEFDFVFDLQLLRFVPRFYLLALQCAEHWFQLDRISPHCPLFWFCGGLIYTGLLGSAVALITPCNFVYVSLVWTPTDFDFPVDIASPSCRRSTRFLPPSDVRCEDNEPWPDTCGFYTEQVDVCRIWPD